MSLICVPCLGLPQTVVPVMSVGIDTRGVHHREHMGSDILASILRIPMPFFIPILILILIHILIVIVILILVLILILNLNSSSLENI